MRILRFDRFFYNIDKKLPQLDVLKVNYDFRYQLFKSVPIIYIHIENIIGHSFWIETLDIPIRTYIRR